MGERPHRVQLSRKKGWRIPDNTVSVARPGLYGNPFPLSYFGGDRAACVAEFRKLAEGPVMRALLPALTGKNLACWCALGTPCHADVLLELANPEPPHAS